MRCVTIAIKFYDMFGGVGGFRYGLQRAGNFECVGYCDIDKYAVQVYNKQFNERHSPTDVRTIDWAREPDFDLLCGGFPCQAFSIAGKRRGFEDTRGTLFFEVAKAIKIKRPKIVFLENVKGLLNHDKGNTFRVIIQTLSELGYDVQWMVFNSKFFGVPQNRERVFIVGSLRGTSRPEILPFGENAGEVERVLKGEGVEKEVVAFDVYNQRLRSECPTLSDPCHNNIRVAVCGNSDVEGGERTHVVTLERKDFREHKEVGVTPTLKERMGTGGNNVPMVVGMLPLTAKKRIFETPKEINEFLKENKKDFTISQIAKRMDLPKTQVEHYFRTDISRAIPSPQDWFKLKNILNFSDKFDKKVTEVYEKEVEYEMNRRIYDSEVLSPTLKTDVPMVVAKHKREGELRRLTPIECERLQAFPDGWTSKGINENGEEVVISDTQRYKQMGNSVTTTVITAIGKKLTSLFGG